MGAGADAATGGRLGLRLGRVLLSHEDADSCGAAVVRWLASTGFEVTGCSAGRVLVAFEQQRPDVVILAGDLQEQEAVTACRWISARSSVPLIVVTAPQSRLDLALVLSSGADFVLPTSVGERELVARVRALLRRTPPRRAGLQASGPYGGMRLDRERGVLELSDGALPLDGRELHLMNLLLCSAPRVTTRATARELLSVDDASLDGLVRRLRERLESIEGWRRIVSIRGVGFRLLESPATGVRPGGPPIVDLVAEQCTAQEPGAPVVDATSVELAT